jgi:hypothetical protein
MLMKLTAVHNKTNLLLVFANGDELRGSFEHLLFDVDLILKRFLPRNCVDTESTIVCRIRVVDIHLQNY